MGCAYAPALAGRPDIVYVSHAVDLLAETLRSEIDAPTASTVGVVVSEVRKIMEGDWRHRRDGEAELRHLRTERAPREQPTHGPRH